MRSSASFLIFFAVTIFCTADANAQWQFCFGMSPGLSKMFPSHPVEGVALSPKVSLTLQSGINYSFNSAFSTMFLVSFSEYADPYTPTWEGEIDGAYNGPVSKRVRIKSSVGFASAFLHNTAAVTKSYVIISSPVVFQYNQDNLFIVLKSGIQWKAPGKYHSVCFSFDYHWGIMHAHQAIIYNSDHTYPAAFIKGRGSYLALNMHVLIGKEKYKWKKASSKQETPPSRNFVM